MDTQNGQNGQNGQNSQNGKQPEAGAVLWAWVGHENGETGVARLQKAWIPLGTINLWALPGTSWLTPCWWRPSRSRQTRTARPSGW